MKMSPEEIIKEGELQKRSENLLQYWKKKTCVLTKDSLNIYADTQKRSKGKQLKFQSIKKVDCVERTCRFIYFTIVTKDDKEIDFRCSLEQECWNAQITMALIDYQNRKALQDFKTRQDNESSSPGQERRMARGALSRSRAQARNYSKYESTRTIGKRKEKNGPKRKTRSSGPEMKDCLGLSSLRRDN